MAQILALTCDLEHNNGWGRYSEEILRRLPKRGFEPVALVQKTARADASTVRALPRLSSFSDGWAKPVRVAWDSITLRRLARDAQIVHCLAEPFAPVAWALSRMTGAKLLQNAVGTYCVSTLESRWRRLYRPAFLAAERIPAISRYTAEQFSRRLPEARTRVVTIPLGVTLPDRSSEEVATGSEPSFLMVGEVKPRKGVLEAVEALARVTPRYPQARLEIIGSARESGYVRRVRERVQALGLEKNVVWHGQVTDEALWDHYQKARALVMPSRNVGGHFEGFGLVHLEANALGVPAVGSLGCGNEDAIRDGYSGFLVEQGNTDQLAEVLLRLLDPAFDWKGMSRNSLEFAKEMSWERVADAYAQVYREVLNS